MQHERRHVQKMHQESVFYALNGVAIEMIMPLETLAKQSSKDKINQELNRAFGTETNLDHRYFVLDGPLNVDLLEEAVAGVDE